MLTEVRGCLFRSEAQALVNTVNCVGPIPFRAQVGRGVALEFKRRYPAMYAAYRSVCERGLLRPGMILPYTGADKLILNFAVKYHWRNPSSHAWVEACLQRFVANYERLGVTSVALPRLGAENGWIPELAPTGRALPVLGEPTYALILEYLGELPIDVELVHYQPGSAANTPI